MSTVPSDAWQDENELAMVRDWFYPSQAVPDPYEPSKASDMRKEAIARVNVWTFKTYKVPAAVIATADLTDSLIHYEEMCQQNKVDSYRATQFMLAFAFLRFVNSFVDRDVARAATANLSISDDEEDERSSKASGERSMYAHAVAIGMPSRFVDIRHQVNHGALPDIAVLAEVVDQALTWLWQRWWKTQATGDPASAMEAFERRVVQTLEDTKD